MKALLNTQKRLNIITLDLVLLVLFTTSTTSFGEKINDDFTLGIIQGYYSGIFGISILCITLYFLLLQFHKFKPDRIDAFICDLCLIFNLLFVVIYFSFLVFETPHYPIYQNFSIYQTHYDSLFTVPYMSSEGIWFSILVMITASILAVYSYAVFMAWLIIKLGTNYINLSRRFWEFILNHRH